MHKEKQNIDLRKPSTFFDYKIYFGHLTIKMYQLIIFTTIVGFLYKSGSKFWFVLFVIALNQIMFEMSKYIFHHYFNLHAELEVMFIGMVVGTYYYGLPTGLVLAVLGTLLFKGQIPLECNFTTFIHDIPNRIIIATAVFLLRGFIGLPLLGLIVTIAYYGVLHSLHELKHHHIPIFEIPTIIGNLTFSSFFFEIVIGMFI